MTKQLEMVITKSKRYFYLKESLNEIDNEYLEGEKCDELYFTSDKQTIVVVNNNNDNDICIPISNIDIYSYYNKPVKVTKQQLEMYKQMNKDK